MKINAVWEYRDPNVGRPKCCRFVAWTEMPENVVAGAVAGYSGGGCFQLEPFAMRLEGGKPTLLCVDGEDRLTGDEADLEDFGPQVIEMTERGLDEVFRWNDKTEWEESENLHLQEGREGCGVLRSGDAIHVGTEMPSWMGAVCRSVALLYWPRGDSE